MYYDASFASNVIDALLLLILWIGSVSIAAITAHYLTKE